MEREYLKVMVLLTVLLSYVLLISLGNIRNPGLILIMLPLSLLFILSIKSFSFSGGCALRRAGLRAEGSILKMGPRGGGREREMIKWVAH